MNDAGRARRAQKLPHVGVTSKTLLVLFVGLFCGLGPAQEPPVNSPLLDHLTGKWVLQGTLAHKQTTHDITAEWVVDHHYVRLHEVSREKKADGKPQYEAIIFIGWNEKPKTYACVWLDVFGGLASESIGVASQKENTLIFVFKDENGSATFKNDFIYDPNRDSWEWIMDNVIDGERKAFGRVKLIRAR